MQPQCISWARLSSCKRLVISLPRLAMTAMPCQQYSEQEQQQVTGEGVQGATTGPEVDGHLQQQQPYMLANPGILSYPADHQHAFRLLWHYQQQQQQQVMDDTSSTGMLAGAAIQRPDSWQEQQAPGGVQLPGRCWVPARASGSWCWVQGQQWLSCCRELLPPWIDVRRLCCLGCESLGAYACAAYMVLWHAGTALNNVYVCDD